MTMTIRPRKIIAGCGTLLPTRSIAVEEPAFRPLPGLARPAGAASALMTRPLRPGAANRVASSISSFVPNPVAPLFRHVRGAGSCAVPAMSTCAHGRPSTNSSRNSAAVIDPALAPPMLVRSAIVESSCARYGRCSGSSQTGSSTTSPGAPHLLDHCRVVAHHAGDLDAERAQAGAGQGRDVDDRVDRLLGGERQAVGHDEPSLGVGVEDLDRLPVAHGEDVAQLHRRCRTACCRCTEVRGDSGRAADRLEGGHRREDRRRRRSCRSSSARGTRRSA